VVGVIAYTVTIEFDDPRVGEAWLGWLRGQHVRDVCTAGAIGAEIVQLDGTPMRLEVRYLFASRDAFETYEREHAPRLCREGLARIPPEGGVRMTRTLGEIVQR